MFDLLPVEQRTASAAALSLSSGFGLIFLSALAFAVRDWRYILIAASAVCFVGLAYQWTVPESLQWLMSRNRILPAQQVFYKILANNRQFVPAGVEVAITNAARSMTKAEQSEQSWTVLLRSPASFRSFLAIIGLCFLTTIINYGILLSIPQLGGGVYFNVLISGVFDIFATLSTWIALRKMHVGRVLFVTAFMSGLLILAAGLIPGGFAMESTIEATRAALVLLGRVGTGTCSFLLYDVIFRVIPLGTQSSVIGLFSIVGITGASVAPLFVHLGRINHEVEFTLLGLMCVCSSFLSFALPPDVPKDLSKGMSDSNVNEALNDPSADEELVFEQLPDISAKSPYVL